MNYPYVSIIIPTFNAAATISETIKGCLNQDYPGQNRDQDPPISRPDIVADNEDDPKNQADDPTKEHCWWGIHVFRNDGLKLGTAEKDKESENGEVES